MKFNCGPTEEERRLAREQWHRVFAWWPQRMDTDLHDCRWLEMIERRYVIKIMPAWQYGSWQYRAVGTEGPPLPEPKTWPSMPVNHEN